MWKRKHIDVVVHRPGATVYQDGRYLSADMKISTRSKRGRQVARDIANSILAEVGANETAHQRYLDNVERLRKGEPLVKAEGERIPTF